MGAYDSSRTRVEPVFDALMDPDPSGQDWLLPLLQLGSRSLGRLDDLTKAALIPAHPRWWGKNERRLNPPKSLLRWLVANACAAALKTLWGRQAALKRWIQACRCFSQFHRIEKGTSPGYGHQRSIAKRALVEPAKTLNTFPGYWEFGARWAPCDHRTHGLQDHARAP